MKSRSVSITGATGFIGTHAVRAFRTHGWKVLAIVRPGSEKTVPDGAAVRHADLMSQGALTAAFAGSEVVVHAAGLVRAASSDELQAVNVGATRAVVAAANAVGARLVHLSSLAAIGPGTPEHPTREDDPPQPVNAYGRSKLAAEEMVRSTATVPWTILRPSAVYGPGDRGFLPLVRLARRGVFLLTAPETMAFTFIYVDDVIDAIVRATERALDGEVLFIGHPRPETTGNLLRGLATELGRRYRPVAVPRPLVRLAAGAGDWVWRAGGRPVLDSSRFAEFTAPGFVCDVSRARERLEFVASVALPEGLAHTVQWYRDHGWI